MAYSIQTAVSDGTLEVLDLSIKYMDKSHIFVYVDDVLVDGSAYSYVWITDTRIQVVPAVASGSTLKVIRKTLTDEMWHEFSKGARFSTTSMDENFEQLLFLAQEYSEGIYVSDFYSDVDLHLKRILNLGDPTADGDAVNLKTLKEYLPNAGLLPPLVERIEAEEAKSTQLALQGIPTGDKVIVGFDGSTLPDNARVHFGGLHTVGDGGGGSLLFLKDSTTSADGVTVYAITGGRLVRDLGDFIGKEWSGAKWDSTADDTAAINLLTKAAITKGKAIDLGDGLTTRVKNAYLNDYTLGTAVAGQGQREHVSSFTGKGGRFSSPVFKATVDATSDDYVLRGNNSAGVVLGGFRINGNNTSRGADFSFIGNASDGVAPSNGNELYNVWCEDFVGVGLNLDQFHDSDIHGIFTRGSGTTTSTVAVSLQGEGGFLKIRDSVLYGGRLRMSCQNGTITDVVLSGLELTGGSYNLIGIRGAHFIAMTSYAIKSNAVGNGTRFICVEDSYFPTGIGSDGYIQGRFWRGGYFLNCQFTSGVITQNIEAASGLGQRPVFVFEGCHFNTTPVFDEINATVVCINCTGPTGVIFNYQSAPSNQIAWFSGLSIGDVQRHSTEGFSTTAGWARFCANLAGIDPQNAPGAYIGWNRSGGRGEVDFVYNKGGGGVAGIDFVDTSTGSYVPQWQMSNSNFAPANDNVKSFGLPAQRASVVYAGTGAINTSDGREKTAPLPIDDAVLDAWGDVQLIAFRWLVQLQEKGDNARWHFGVIAQQVRDAFAARGLDGTRYGLLCYDEWEDVYEPLIEYVITDGKLEPRDTGEKRLVRSAGNRWGIRSDQCLFVEAAYQRRRCDLIEQRLDVLEYKQQG